MLKNLFKKQSLDELEREAAAHFEAGAFSEAKRAYDRLAERAKHEPAVRAAAEARADRCCDALAEARAKEAERLHKAGERELGRDELQHALDIARDAALKARLEALALSFEQREKQRPEEPAAAPLSDEERLMLITSGWDEAQSEELEGYGDALLEALLAIEREDGAAASALLAELVAAHPKARYLYLEVARAYLAQKALDQAEEALRTFVDRLGPEGGGTPRLVAHRELARMAHERGARDAAVAELEAAAAALSDDPRAFLDLGNYLRAIERPKEAIEVLALCEAMFPEGKVEWPVTLELGLAHADAGDDARGVTLLEAVVQQLLQKGERDLPPVAAVALARLHERGGNHARAADLFRLLTTGSDVDNHARYHLEAARLLDVLELTDEAARMRAKAQALGGVTSP